MTYGRHPRRVALGGALAIVSACAIHFDYTTLAGGGGSAASTASGSTSSSASGGGATSTTSSSSTSATSSTAASSSGSSSASGSSSSSGSSSGGSPCTCACDTLVASGGCGDLCDRTKSGGSAPNFCNGVPALAQCAACLTAKCTLTTAKTQDGTLCKSSGCATPCDCDGDGDNANTPGCDGGDCNDHDPLVNSKQTAWFDMPGSNGWDYNCSGASESEFTVFLNCGPLSSCDMSTPAWTSGQAQPACGAMGQYGTCAGMVFLNCYEHPVGTRAQGCH